jgi:hypothetical protein
MSLSRHRFERVAAWAGDSAGSCLLSASGKYGTGGFFSSSLWFSFFFPKRDAPTTVLTVRCGSGASRGPVESAGCAHSIGPYLSLRYGAVACAIPWRKAPGEGCRRFPRRFNSNSGADIVACISYRVAQNPA